MTEETIRAFLLGMLAGWLCRFGVGLLLQWRVRRKLREFMKQEQIKADTRALSSARDREQL